MTPKKIKPFGFRPSEKALAILETYMKEHKLTSKSQAVNDIIEQHQTLQLPQDITGVLLRCPLRPYEINDLMLDEPITVNALVDTSVCKSCPKNPCTAWEDAESWERISK